MYMAQVFLQCIQIFISAATTAAQRLNSTVQHMVN